MSMNCQTYAFLAIAVMAFFGCDQQTDTDTKRDETNNQDSKALIIATNYPLYFFAESIGGKGIDVLLPMSEDIDPAFWNPTIDDVVAMQKAEVILLNGSGYESWLNKVALDESRLVDTSASFVDDLVATEQTTHSHGLEGEHSHGAFAFTTWLDFTLAEQQMRAVEKALSDLQPENVEHIAQNAQRLTEQLLELDQHMRLAGEQLKGQPILYSHSVYQYLQRRYVLNGVALHWEPDVFPSDEQWLELDELLQTHAATIMLWEDIPVANTVEKLADRGIQVAVFNPTANRPADDDYLDIMRKNVEGLSTIR